MLARSGIRGFVASVELSACLSIWFSLDSACGHNNLTLDGTMGSRFNSSLYCGFCELLAWRRRDGVLREGFTVSRELRAHRFTGLSRTRADGYFCSCCNRHLSSKTNNVWKCTTLRGILQCRLMVTISPTPTSRSLWESRDNLILPFPTLIPATIPHRFKLAIQVYLH